MGPGQSQNAPKHGSMNFNNYFGFGRIVWLHLGARAVKYMCYMVVTRLYRHGPAVGHQLTQGVYDMNKTLLEALGFAYGPDQEVKGTVMTWRKALAGDALLSAGTGEDGWGPVPDHGPFTIYLTKADGDVLAWEIDCGG